MVKQCSKCKMTKPESGFHKKVTSKNGLHSNCKECRKKYYEENKEKIKAKQKTWHNENKERLNAKTRQRYNNSEQYRQRKQDNHRKWRENNSDKVKARNEEYQKKYPERNRAIVVVYRALKRGAIARPERCINCNVVKSLDAHHEDYNKPLEVVWLCKSCHKLLHLTAIVE